MIQIVILIAIVATGVLIYFKSRVEHRRNERSNRLAEKQDELMELLRKSSKEPGDENK